MDQIWEPEEVRSPKCSFVPPNGGNLLLVYMMNETDPYLPKHGLIGSIHDYEEKHDETVSIQGRNIKWTKFGNRK
ncbi:unnamed protein product, partial [Microthlaspi erraticum]